MSKSIQSPKVAIQTFPWKNDGSTSRKVVNIFVENMGQALRLIANDPQALLELRREFAFGIMEIERMEAAIKFPESMKQPLNSPKEVA